MDTAAAEWASAVGALAVNSALIAGLGMAIRKANGFDEEKPTEEAQPVIMSEIQTQEIPRPGVTATDPIEQPEVNEGSSEGQMHEGQVLAAAAISEASKVDAAAETVRAWISDWQKRTEESIRAVEAQTSVPDVEGVRKWIESWRASQVEAEAEAFTVPSSSATTKVTEPSFPGSVATKVSQEIRSDAATSVVNESSNNTFSNGSSAKPVVTGVDTAVLASEASTAPLENLETQKVQTQVLENENVSENGATEAGSMARRTVTITDKYQEKIDSLWEDYNTKKSKAAQFLAKQEKITMDLQALQEEKQSTKNQKNPLDVFVAILRSVLSSIVAFIAAIIARVRDTDGKNVRPGAPAH